MKFNIKTILRIVFILSCVNVQATQELIQAQQAAQLAQQIHWVQQAQQAQLAIQVQQAQLAIQAQQAQAIWRNRRQEVKYIAAGTQLFLNLIGMSPLCRITLGSIIMGITSKGHNHPNVSTADVIASYVEGATTVEFYRFMFDAIRQVILSYR